MIRRFTRLSMLAGACLLPVLAAAQAPPMPTPGPEHAVLKEDVGTWDAAVEMMMPGAPTAPPSKGVEVSTLGCNSLCLITDFKGEMMGAPFQGHGVSTWDGAKKKYVGSWSDSMAPGLATTEATWDAATKTMNGTMDAPDGQGGTVKMRSTVQYTADGKRVFSMFMASPDGKEMPTMRITYTRRK
jgi:hypothetical protein